MGTPAELGFYPSGLAWTGSEIGIAAYNDDILSDVVFARFDPAGAMIGSFVELTSGADPPNGPSTDMVWTGSEFVVVGHTFGGPGHIRHYFRLDPTGAVLDSATFDVPSSEINGFRLLWTGSETAAFWGDLRAGPETIMFGRLTLAGSKPAEDIRLTGMEFTDLMTDVAWAGSQFAMTWQTHTGSEEIPNFQRFDRFGIGLGDEINIDGMLAWTSSEFLVLDGLGDASRIGAGGEILMRSTSARIPPGTIQPGMYDLAWSGDAAAVVAFGFPFRFLMVGYCY
jgi:hypothetical protein